MSRVLMLLPRQRGREEAAAVTWLREQADHEPAMLAIDDLNGHPEALRSADVIWIHASAGGLALHAEVARLLRARIHDGAGLLLTLLATPAVVALDLERQPPNAQRSYVWHDDADDLWLAGFREWPGYPHIRGLQSWGRHPLFNGLGRGAFTWHATEGESVSEATYVRPRWPERARVVAVERAYVQLNADRAVAWEYLLGAGRVLCIGAHLRFAAPHRLLAEQRDRVARNALQLLARREPVAASWWPSPESIPVPPGEDEVVPITFGAALPEIASPLTLTSLAASDDPYTLAGRRALALGGERRGLIEIWLHPLCVLSGGMEVRVDGEEPTVRSVEVAPAQIVRQLQTRSRHVEERLFVPHDLSAVFVEYRLRRVGGSRASVQAPRIDVRMRCPLRLEWPIPPDALRPLRTISSISDGLGAIAVIGRDDRFRAQVSVQGNARVTVEPDRAEPRVVVSGHLTEPLRLAWLGAVAGRTAIARTARTIERLGVRELATRRSEALALLQHEHLSLRSPSASLDRAIEWAKVRLASFMATAPGVGTGLMAGYAQSNGDWAVSRPGYAWFFGRDACWSGLALLATGAFGDARQALDFLADWQDVTGKIPHEVTTSGVAHYDAADATPLWLLFVGEYVRWTGDTDAARRLWPRVLAAAAYVSSTDRDDNGLPENTEVGHGWIESGPFGGGAVTSYVAAIWVAALEALVPVAAQTGDLAAATRWSADATRARRTVRQTLVDPATGRVALHRMRDGSLVTDVTALAAVPAALGLQNPLDARAFVDGADTKELSAPWGVRLISPRHAQYSPAGYHSGAVWPLYTGWMALAAYRAHLGEHGFRHLMSNAMLCYDRAKGAFDEVLSGDDLESAGVCPDQAWSAAMVPLPLVLGLLGARPDAPNRRLELTPHWPREWTRAEVRSLRVGDAHLHLEATEGCLVEGIPHDGVRYRLRVTPPGSLTIVLEHPVGARSFTRTVVNGVDAPNVRCGTAECPHVRITLWLAEPADVQFVGDRMKSG